MGGVIIKNNNFIKDNNKKYIRLALYILMIIFISILFHKFISNVNVNNIFPSILKLLSPFIYGLIIAYILNPGMKFIENNIYCHIKYLNKNIKLKRTISIITTYIFLIGFIVWIIAYIVPELNSNIQNIIAFIKTIDIKYIENVFDNYIFKNETLKPISAEVSEYTITMINRLFNEIINSAKYIPNMLNAVITGTVGFASYLINLILGIVIGFYMLSDKEIFAGFSCKVLYTFLSEKTAEKIINISKESNRVFENFFIGKMIDSLIIGILFFLGCLVIDPNYQLLLSLIIGITNMIPYFGPFIGGIPVVLLVLLSTPSKALWIAIFILLLQQFDGIFLGPKILGNSIGVKPIGVIFAIIVGGALFGPLGMFFGVPVFAVISSMFSVYVNSTYYSKKDNSEEN